MATTLDPEATTRLTLSRLESHLWGAAGILRGSIDSADYKHYIFGLVFFKRLSNVRLLTTDIGQHVKGAFQVIEDANVHCSDGSSRWWGRAEHQCAPPPTPIAMRAANDRDPLILPIPFSTS